MERHINNPYKLNWKIYVLIGGISAVIMSIAVVWYDRTDCLVMDIIKNLAFGCVASTIVAFLLEIGNIKEKNVKANSVYDAVYDELKFRIQSYVETWSCLCKVAYKDENYKEQKHTWIEWYEITKKNFFESDENRQLCLIDFFSDQLIDSINGIEKALKQIEHQEYLLNIHGIYDEDLRSIFNDYSFEFYAARLTLERHTDKDDFWNSFDAIRNDLVRYINKWIDIQYFNYVRFAPYEFYGDKEEIVRAILESKAK